MKKRFKLLIPEKAEKEITFMLFNINNIDELINKRKEYYYNSIRNGNREYLKSLKIESNTMEDIIGKIDEDYRIKRYIQFKELIIEFIKDISNNNEIDYIYNEIFTDKYINKYSEKNIGDKFKFSVQQIKEMDMLLKWIIYNRAISKGIYKKEVTNE
ncbi:MAG: hypothetical protein IJ223_07345 [Clostridia bacterium]|nr:hypothetical protein [Clostridia bacterium]